MSQEKHILVVDDEPNIRLMFLTALEVPGRLGDAGPERPGGPRPPRRGGSTTSCCSTSRCPAWGAWRCWKLLCARGDDVPVIVVTAHGSVPDAVKAMRLGAVDFLPKPVTPEQIRAAVDEVLAARRARRRA